MTLDLKSRHEAVNAELDPIFGNIVETRKRTPMVPLDDLADSVELGTDDYDIGEMSDTIFSEFQAWLEQKRDEGIDPGVVEDAIFVNLLTEDNLPHYTTINSGLAHGKWQGIQSWVNRWTSEERPHSDVIEKWSVMAGVLRGDKYRRYIKGRDSQLQQGIDIVHDGPDSALPYVTIQEYSTYIAHRNLGKLVGGSLDKILAKVARDEASHYKIYSTLTKEALKIDPDLIVIGIAKVIKDFRMPGRLGIPDFDKHAEAIAVAGIFDLTSVMTAFRKTIDQLRILDVKVTEEPAKKALEDIQRATSDRKLSAARRAMEILREKKQKLAKSSDQPAPLIFA